MRTTPVQTLHQEADSADEDADAEQTLMSRVIEAGDLDSFGLKLAHPLGARPKEKGQGGSHPPGPYEDYIRYEYTKPWTV